jgi:dephospho-CoA kinase
MLRVGLTGGFASGKSFVARELEALGCVVIHADQLGHAVLAPGAEAYDAVLREFGSGILLPDGAIDRRRLAALVFHDPERLARLNSLVHPHVFARQEQLIAQAHAADPHAIVVVEAAIMYETGSDARYHKMIVAVCSLEQQIERAMKRDHLTRDEVLARLSRQIPLAEKARRADYVIDTSGPKEETIRQTRLVYQSLRSLVP